MSKTEHAPEVILCDVGDYLELTVNYGPGGNLPAFHKEAVGNEQALANAEFALEAYNHHAELVTRLEDMVRQFDDNFPEGGESWKALNDAKETLKKLKS